MKTAEKKRAPKVAPSEPKKIKPTDKQVLALERRKSSLERLAVLDARLGRGVGATRERERHAKRIALGNEALIATGRGGVS